MTVLAQVLHHSSEARGLIDALTDSQEYSWS